MTLPIITGGADRADHSTGANAPASPPSRCDS